MSKKGTVVEEEKAIISIKSEAMNDLDINGGPSSLFGSETPPPQGVKYRVEYINEKSSKVIHSIPTDRLDFEVIDAHGEIFDIVTTFLTPEEEVRSTDSSKDSKEAQTRRAPLVTDTRRKVDMHIHSPAIIHALRSVVKYYPGQNLMGESIIVPGPTYAILVHHEEELREYAEKCYPSLLEEPVCPREKDAYHDIKILQEFLEQTIMPDVKLERERNLRGLETFEMSWVRKRPGKTFKFVRDDTMQWVVGVIESVNGGTIGFGGVAWTTGYWYLDYNGSFLGPCKASVINQRFEGEQGGDFMQVIEDSAFEEPLAESVKEFVEQGEKCFKLMTKKCQYYDGTTFDFPHHQVRRLILLLSMQHPISPVGQSSRLRFADPRSRDG
jgi:hypothetical protein